MSDSTSAAASMRTSELRDGIGASGSENTGEAPSEERAFAEASAARDTKVIRSLRQHLGRRKPKEQLTLLPAEAEAATAAVKLRARDLDVKLKRLLAWVVIIAVSLQLLVADFFLIHYTVLSHRPPSDAVIIAWLSASVVEVIGIVAIVARNLFPNRARARSRKGRKK